MSDRSRTPLDASRWALSAPIDDPTSRIVLLSLASYASDSGLAWPHIGTLADHARCSERTVRRRLNQLEDGGYLDRVRVRRGGQYRGWVFRLAIPGARAVAEGELPGFAEETDLPDGWADPVPPDRLADGHQRTDWPLTNGQPCVSDDQRTAMGVRSRTTKGEEPRANKPTSQPDGSDPSLDLEAEPASLDFEKFWRAYPRHHSSGRLGGGASKAKARDIWQRLDRTEKLASLHAVDNYAAEIEQTGQYVAHATTWLNEQRWEVYDTPPDPPERSTADGREVVGDVIADA